MSTEETPPDSSPQPTPKSGVFPGSDEFNADSERFARIAEALLGSLPIGEGIRALAKSDGMTPKQALYQLTRWARGSMAPFLRRGTDGEYCIDLSTGEARANQDLLQRVEEKRYTVQTLLGPVQRVETTLELYSAVEATKKIMELHGLAGSSAPAVVE
jgi:hypothetical protein